MPKISELPVAASLDGTEKIPGVKAGVTDYFTAATLAAYIAGTLTGAVRFRSVYSAAGNTFPASGGSGTAGAIRSGDLWIVSVAGTLGGTPVTAGDWIIAKTDTPGQTAGNWSLIEHDLGFTPANDTLVLHLAGAETVAGQKKFTLRPITSEQAAFTGIPVDGTTDASTLLAALDGAANDLSTLVVKNGETLYVNTDLTLTNIEIDVKKGGLIKVGTGHTFKTPIKNPGLRTILDTTGTPGLFVPTNQEKWQFIWWGPVVTSNDSATYARAFAAKAPLGVQLFTGFNSGQKYDLPVGISRIRDVDIPEGCDVGGVFGGSMLGLCSTGTNVYMIRVGRWSGLHDCWVDSRGIAGKTLVWLTGQRSYATNIYGGGLLGDTGGQLGQGGIFLRLGQQARTITDGVISGGTTLTSTAALFTTADIGRGVSDPGDVHIPNGTTITAYVSPTVVTLSATSTNGAVNPCTIGQLGSLALKVTNIFGLGAGDGTGISNDGTDIEWSNVWTGSFGRNIDASFGALMGNGIHTWGATTDGLRGPIDGSRLTNFYSETNGWWGADLTGSDGSIVDSYYFWKNGIGGVIYSQGGARTITDGVISGGTTLTSTQALFCAADINRIVSGTGIPAGTTITAYAANGGSCTLSATATNGAVASVAITHAVYPTAIFCGHNVLGNGVFDDNGDTAIELGDSKTTYVTGAMLYSREVNALGHSPVSRRGIHAGRNSTSTVRAKGSNSFFSQKLKVDDSLGGMDIELGRKRVVPTADYIDTAATPGVLCSFPYGYNDEWDLDLMIVAMGSMTCDFKFRVAPSGANTDGYLVCPGLLGASQSGTSADNVAAASAIQLNSTSPQYLPGGLISDTIKQGYVAKGRFLAGTTTADAGNLEVQAGGLVAGGARGTPTVTDATFNGTTTITSPGNNFATTDAGRPISGTGIPANAYVVTAAAGSITISAATTGNGSSGGLTGNTVTLGTNQTKIPALGLVLEGVRRG